MSEEQQKKETMRWLKAMAEGTSAQAANAQTLLEMLRDKDAMDEDDGLEIKKAYLETITRMEDGVVPVDHNGSFASMAISLKRIADCMETIEDCSSRLDYTLKKIAQVMGARK